MSGKIFLMFDNLTALVMGLAPHAKSQVSQEGTPPSQQDVYKSEMASIGQVEKKTLSPVNADSMRKEDSIEQAQPKPVPPRFGKKMKVDMGIENAGTWDTLANGDKIWRLRIHSPGAKSLNFIFDEFNLPEGAELYIYNDQKKHLKGAFTSANNKPSGIFATDVIPGDKVFLEYKLPHDIETKGELKLESITHGYKEVYLEETGHGESGDCHVDANCPEGDDWCLQKRSTALIIVDGDRSCSGNLITNVEQDETPFFLTAEHCTQAGDDFDNWVFRFRYYDPDPSCPQDSDDANEPMNFFNFAGADFRAESDETDFLLLELHDTPPTSVVYYAGWTRENDENNHPNHVTKFSHPQGDLMKIGLANDIDIAGSPDPVPSHQECCWRFPFYEGVSEGGSSGAGLFNEDHLIIGQNYGGFSDCDNLHSNNFYGRFDLSWDLGLSDWLDPNNTNEMTVQGFSCCPKKALYQNTTNIPEYTSVNEDIKAGKDVGLDHADNGPAVIESGENATFQAGEEIKLNEGFKVEHNGEFSAEIQKPCNEDEENCFENTPRATPPDVFNICCDGEDRYCFPVSGADYFNVNVYNSIGQLILSNEGEIDGSYACLFELGSTCLASGTYFFEIELYGCNYQDFSETVQVTIQQVNCKKGDGITQINSSLKKDENNKKGLHIYPNPFQDEINMEIKLPVASAGDLKFFDASGKLVLQHKCSIR